MRYSLTASGFILLFFSLSASCFSQDVSCIVEGIVVDNETGEPLVGANVFVPNSMLGTLTDSGGKFSLKTSTCELQQIAISFLGYTSFSQWADPGGDEVQIKLRPAVQHLATAEVTAKKDRKRKKRLRQFQEAILGSTSNANQCAILNPEVILLWEEGGALRALATELILIENQALGYRIHFSLEKFEMREGLLQYAGKPMFEFLDPADQSQARDWKKEREASYMGSLRHFLVTLHRGESESSGYRLMHAREDGQGGVELLGKANSNDLVSGGSGGRYELILPGLLYVEYTREKDHLKKAQTNLGTEVANLGQPAEKEMMQHGFGDLQSNEENQVSYLFARKSSIRFDEHGFILNAGMLKEYGYWSVEGLADQLPREYLPGLETLQVVDSSEEPDRIPEPEPTQSGPMKKGFILSDLRIPASEIRDGGPPKDGIPSIDQPKFTDDHALDGTDLVLAVSHNGIAKAYPIRILNYHEIVNDDFGGEPIVITYCPLCRSGLAYDGMFDGQVHDFGVSGLLYNSDVLVYDRQTESLWSQIKGEAVSGKMSGTPLHIIPSVITTWAAWKAQHPESLVLSEDTGHSRDYSKEPYASYVHSETLYFPVANKSEALPNKQLVLGLEVNGKFKAYSLRALSKASEVPFTDMVGEKAFIIHFDTASNTAWATTSDGALYPGMTLYWFAWYAFHPETEVYK